jgi:hypothetical protein
MSRTMMNQNNQSIDFEALPIQSVMLSQKQFEQAVAISDRTVTESRQWTTYLNALALFGFQEWFTEHAPELALDWQQCSIFKPQYANVIEAAFNLRINNFKLCLVAMGGGLDSGIRLPRAVMDLSEFQSHFYIVVRVFEEQGQVQVQSFLRYDQWVAQQETSPVNAQPDWTYLIPAEWFDPNPNRLLLHLNCLEPQALSLSAPVPPAPSPGTKDQQWLAQRLSQAESVETPLWQLMSWQEGAGVLTDSALLDWLYLMQTGQVSLAQPQTETVQSLMKPILKAKDWLQNELDDMAQSLGWILLPPFAELRGSEASSPATQESAAFSPADTAIIQELDLIRKQLHRQGTPIPTDTRCVYHDLALGDMPLRLYAMTWLLQETEAQPPEWVLLLILKSQTDAGTHSTVTLSIKDPVNLLLENGLNPKTENNFIYAHVVGELHETFLVTLALDTGETQALPLFAFYADE